MDICITKCDHCKKIIDSNNEEYKVEILGSSGWIELPGYSEYVSLCTHCLEELKNYIKDFINKE